MAPSATADHEELNPPQVAGLDKPQRTRVLEREVQRGIHEKVQGGYGKYQGPSFLCFPEISARRVWICVCGALQTATELTPNSTGTWVPMDIGIQICQQYNIEGELRPIIDYVPTSDSPPPAPKHLVNAPGSRTKKVKEDSQQPGEGSNAPSPASTSAGGPRKAGRPSAGRSAKPPPRRSAAAAAAAAAAERSREMSSMPSRTPTPSGDEEDDFGSNAPSSHHSEAPPPAKRRRHDQQQALQQQQIMHQHQHQQQHQQQQLQQQQHHQQMMSMPLQPMMASPYPHYPQQQQQQQHPGLMPHLHHPGMPMRPPSQPAMVRQMPQVPPGPDRYARLILDYFVSEIQDVPDFLLRPPPGFDPNVTIDDDEHTALHWASAMGRVQVVDLLLRAGANIFATNRAGQTPLMRAVMFTNNYDTRRFPELYQLLRRATLNLDESDRTVFHHIAELALYKGKISAARYYLEAVLKHVNDLSGDMANVLNFRNHEGETCLTLAARAHSRGMVSLLIAAGADPSLPNSTGKSAQDYVLEDKRLRQTDPLLSTSSGAGALSGAEAVDQMQSFVAAAAAAQSKQLFQSQAAQLLTTRAVPQLSELLSSMASTYEADSIEREKDAAQAAALLGNIQTELEDARSTLGTLRSQLDAQSPSLPQLQEEEKQLEHKLKVKMAQRFVQGWNKYIAEEEQRWAHCKASGSKEMPPDVQELHQAPETTFEEALEATSAEIQALQEEKRALTEQVVQMAATGPQPIHQEQPDGSDNNNNNSGSGGNSKIEQYRKLLSLGTGLDTTEMDSQVGELMENLEDGVSEQ